MTDSFPRRQARTRRFTLGAPRGFTISPDGDRVVFLRSRGGTDPVTCLWTLDLTTGAERLVADPAALDSAGDEDLPPEERARRERSREQAGGVVGYATDRATSTVAFAYSGQLYVVDLTSEAAPRRIDTPGGVIDPRPDPHGRHVAYVSGRALHVHDLEAGTTSTLAAPDGPEVSYGLADFVAAEEMERMRGYWWSPAGDALVVARVDDTPVQRWHIADPAHPDRNPTVVAYPAAGTPNALVSAEVITLDGRRTPIRWTEEYLADVVWDDHGLLVVVQPRDQTALRALRVDPATGATALDHERTDPVWVDIVPGVPAHTAAGAPITVADAEGARRLVVDGVPVTPTSLQVRSVLDVDGETVLLRASETPESVGLWTWSPDGLAARTARGRRALRQAAGRHAAGRPAGPHGRRRGARRSSAPGRSPRWRRTRSRPAWSLGSHCAARATAACPPRCCCRPATSPAPGCRCSWTPTAARTPSACVAARNAHLTSQWFADQGFAVVVVDGRGTPGRGPAFERAVHGDLAAPVLEDQVDALHAVAAEHPDLDLSRVGIRGWSFGGYLAALAVLRRPDVFHAAVAGAPVTDWALYDTHYTERYLGRPDTDPEAYARSSLFADAAEAGAPAAARARPRRRQRRGGAHPAAVLGPARRRTTAQRAAAVGGDAHDAAGGRRGEPPAAAGAVPEGGAS